MIKVFKPTSNAEGLEGNCSGLLGSYTYRIHYSRITSSSPQSGSDKRVCADLGLEIVSAGMLHYSSGGKQSKEACVLLRVWAFDLNIS